MSSFWLCPHPITVYTRGLLSVYSSVLITTAECGHCPGCNNQSPGVKYGSDFCHGLPPELRMGSIVVGLTDWMRFDLRASGAIG